MDKRIVLCALAALLVGAVTVYAADIDGKWVAKMQGRPGGARPGAKGAPGAGGGQEFVVTFNFKADGEKLTGTISNPAGGETEISEGKIRGNDISFKIKREFQEKSFVMLYKGKIEGDQIKFTQSIEGMDRPPREFTAQRVK